jgi:hypothetical protein
MIKCLLTELGRAGREYICLLVILYGHDLEPNIFTSGPPTHVNKYLIIHNLEYNETLGTNFSGIYVNKSKLMKEI